jgi:plasmid stabilization system protein ParE
MAFEVIHTLRFERDLESALDYLVYELDARSTAKSLYDKVLHVVSLLKETPCMCQVSTKEVLASKGLREYLANDYEIVYSVTENAVVLRRFLHQSQLIDDKV